MLHQDLATTPTAQVRAQSATLGSSSCLPTTRWSPHHFARNSTQSTGKANFHMLRTTAIALFLGCTALGVQADQMTVADLQQICAGSSLDTQNACRFFILGVVEGASLGNGAKTAAGPLCIAPGVSDTALVAGVKKMMQADLVAFPEDKSLAAAGFVVAAAMKVFPCK